MAKILQREFEDSLDFSNKLVNEIKNNFRELLKLLAGLKEIYDREEKKLPYHINLIDELHANENAHSRILAKLLQQQEPTSKRHEILESFIKFIIEKHYNKVDFHKIKIKSPLITQEKERIDLWIRDFDYAIVFENKVAWASDQPNQLERYIDVTKEYGFKNKEEQIYVLYLSPTYDKEPNQQTWGSYYNSDIYKNRYLKLSFKDDILQWLKNNVLPNVQIKDKYLSSAIEQYIDHLEGVFSLRAINNNMNMELQEFIKKELNLIGIETEKSIDIVLSKKQEMINAINQLDQLRKQIIAQHFQEWGKLLKTDFPNHEIVRNWNNPDTHINVGVKFNFEGNPFSTSIEYWYKGNIIYYGIGKHHATQEKNSALNFEEIISEFNFDASYEWWYGWKHTSFSNAYMRLKNLIKRIENQYK